MKLNNVLENIVDPSLDFLFNLGVKKSYQAKLMLLTIGLQESEFLTRQQVKGPARSYWQFELGGGIKGVLSHSASKHLALAVCQRAKVDATPSAVYKAMLTDDFLGCCFARLLLFTDRQALPNDVNFGWNYYIRNWNPGKPHPKKWPNYWLQSEIALKV